MGVDSCFIVNRLNYFNICKQYYCIMSLKRKRTVAEEKRVFNSKWEFDYFMIETEAHTMMCLICGQVVKTMKGDNAKQHFRPKICVEN